MREIGVVCAAGESGGAPLQLLKPFGFRPVVALGWVVHRCTLQVQVWFGANEPIPAVCVIVPFVSPPLLFKQFPQHAGSKLCLRRQSERNYLAQLS